jgi:hypothetical protein
VKFNHTFAGKRIYGRRLRLQMARFAWFYYPLQKPACLKC